MGKALDLFLTGSVRQSIAPHCAGVLRPSISLFAQDAG
jgi:hypothetical protein